MHLANLKRVARKIAKRAPYLTLTLTVAAMVIHIFYSSRPHLIYERFAIADGEFWRLISCHWVHLNADHLLWSSMTFLLLGSICEIMDRGKYLMTIVLSAIFIPAGIWFVMPQLDVYGGLSGLDCALYSLLVILFIKREWRYRNWFWITFYSTMLVLLPAKVIYESISGLTIFVSNHHTNMVPVPHSHLLGGIIGFAVGMVPLSVDSSKIFAALDLHISCPPCKYSDDTQALIGPP
jgi:rhomboid family GlyGly-CTERM serine protease